MSVTPRNAVGRASPADSLESLRVRALVSLQLLFARYRKGLSEASDRVTPEETLVLRDLEERGLDAEGLRVMLSGGHVVVDDPELYERWVFPESNQRLSSHHRDVDKKQHPDYGMVGPLVRQSLHGRTSQGTWIQWERTATAFKLGRRLKWRDLVHIKDYVVYRLTRKNVGPWGLSDATEKRPLYLQPRVSLTRRLPPEVAAGFISALGATTGPDRISYDSVRSLFAPPPLIRIPESHREPHGRRAGMLGGVPLAVRRVRIPVMHDDIRTVGPPRHDGTDATQETL